MMALRKQTKRWLYGSMGRFPYFGTTVYFPRGSHLFLQACKQGIFEREICNVIASLIEPGTTYFDLGANIGLLSVPILKKVSSCRVVSVEPSPNTVPYLQKTQANSAYRDRWKVIPKGVSDQVGEADFTVSEPAMGAFDGFVSTGRVAAKGVSRVAVTTVDTEWKDLGKPRVSVIKCDVEGAELSVFEGARECIIEDRPVILTEWNSTNLRVYGCDPSCLLKFADSVGYGVYGAPYAERIKDPIQLHCQMAMGNENFLLAPLM